MPYTNKRENMKRWTSRSLGSRFQHRIFYTMIRIGGRNLAYILLYIVVFYYVLIKPSVRKKTGFYLSRRFSKKTGWKNLTDRYRISLSLGKVLIDRAVIGILGQSEMKIEFKGRERLMTLLSRKNGFILMNAHVGGWQVVLPAMTFFARPVNMLLEQDEADVDLQYFEHAGLPSPFRIIDPGSFLGGSLEMLDVLAKGEILCVMGDRVFGSDKNVIEVPFLEGNALFPVSAYKIASAAGVPIAVFFSHKAGPNRYELEIVDIIDVPSHLGRSKEVFRPYVTRFVTALESFAHYHPYQFFNFYDMWK